MQPTYVRGLDGVWGRQTGGSYCVGGPDGVYRCGAGRLVEPTVYRGSRQVMG